MKISIQTGDLTKRLGKEKAYDAIKAAGFEAIDWNLDQEWSGANIRNGTYRGKCIFEKPLNEVIDYFMDELEMIRKNGLHITQAHAPFPCFRESDPDFLDYAIEIYKRNIEYCNFVGCKNLVIHGASCELNITNNTERIREVNHKLYSSLIPTLLENNVTVCLENLFTVHNGVCYQGHCSYPSQAVEEIDALNKEAGKEIFGFCFDTGHANILHHDMRSFIEALGKRLKCLHIHDNNGSSDQHLAPMTGTADWNIFCSALKAIEYDGDLNFETFSQTNKALDFCEDAVYPWIKLINETGKIFRNIIEG